MLRRALITAIAAAGLTLAAPFAAFAQSTEETPMPDTAVKSGYVPVNGVEMYYEVHGDGGGTPLVLLHGAFSAIGTSFGKMLPELATDRTVIAFELQAHGRTADTDRPLRIENLADDVAKALASLGYTEVDIFGYSSGGAVAMHVARNNPELVRKLVLASVSFTKAGTHAILWENMDAMKPEMMYGSPWHEEYLAISPTPDGFDNLFAKKSEMDRNITEIPLDEIKAMGVPMLIAIGDSDIVVLDHAVEMFKLLGGGVIGEMGMPTSQLLIVPGTAHSMMPDQGAILLPAIQTFLDAPVPAE